MQSKRPLTFLHAHATRRNVGDDAIVLAIHGLAAQAFPDRDIRFFDISRDTDPAFGGPVQRFLPLYAYHRPRHWPGILSCLARADAIVIGGGEILAGGIEFLGLGLLGLSAGVPVIFSGIGVDLSRASRLNRAYSGFVARRASVFLTRDEAAAGELRELGVRPERIHVAPDLVLALEVPTLPVRVPSDQPRVGVSLRPMQSPEFPVAEAELGAVARLLDSLVESKNASILLLPFLDPQAPFPTGSSFASDRDVLLRMAQLMKHQDRVTLYQGSLKPADVIRVLAGLHGLVAMRLHAAILGLKAGIRPLAIEYAPKTRRALTRLGFGDRVVRFDELTTPGMVERVLTDPVDPAIMAALAEEVRTDFARIAGPVGAGRRGISWLRFPLAFLALLGHAAIALYAALPPLRRSRRLPSGSTEIVDSKPTRFERDREVITRAAQEEPRPEFPG
jgi:polysaccharide pyruvyl transferase WcaK-like protein